MRYYLDTEFAEKPCTIDLISVAIVAEDGREFYAESADVEPDECNEWVQKNVLPKLGPPSDRMTRPAIRDAIREFIGGDKPEFWGYYADYDWVVFCWLFGAMIDLPHGWPMYCRDLKQALDEAGNPRVPFRPAGEHNALADARWNREAHVWLCAGCAGATA